MMDATSTTPLYLLVENDELSARGLNICSRLGITSLESLVMYYLDKGGFIDAQNCGKKTESELIGLCEEYIRNNHISRERQDMSPVSEVRKKLEELPKPHFNSLLRLVDFELRRIPESVRIEVRKILRYDSIEALYQLTGELVLPHVRSRKSTEAVEFISKLRTVFISYVRELFMLKVDDVRTWANRMIIKRLFEYEMDGINLDIDSLFTINGKVRLFKVIELIFKHGVDFDDRERMLISNEFEITSGSRLTLEEMGSKFGLTRERMRQIREKSVSGIAKRFPIMYEFETDDMAFTDHVDFEDVLIINSELVTTINNLESVRFNALFYTSILNRILASTHRLVDAASNGLRYDYMIDYHLFESIDLVILFEKTGIIRTTEQSSEVRMEFDQFRIKKPDLPEAGLDERSLNVIVTIIENEIPTAKLFTDKAVVPRNTSLKKYEYVCSVLEWYDELMSLQDIMTGLQLLFPEVQFDDQTVRSSMHREKDVFIFIGRSGVYGLKKWENEKERIRGGTIREIVYELLDKSESLLHISEILLEVNRYRKSNERSVITNLRLDQKNTFRFFPGEYVGLTRKSYGDTDLQYKKVIGSHFRRSVLAKYDGWKLDEVIAAYRQLYDYSDVQLRSILERKIQEGVLRVTE